MDELPAGIAVNLFPQVVDIHVYDIGEGVEGVVPAMLRDHGSGHDLVRITHEVFEKVILLGGGVNFLIIAPDLVRYRI